MNAGILLDRCAEAGITFYTGVPDSQLKGLCDELYARYGTGGKEHIVITQIPYTMIGSGIGKFLNDVYGLVENKKTDSKKNAEKFNLGNIRIINAEAPEGLESLPPLDAAIIGGSGQNLPQIFAALDEKLKTGGRIVINAITMQTLTEIFTVLKEYDGYKTETVSAQVNRLHKAGAHDMFLALNPVYILTCEKRR